VVHQLTTEQPVLQEDQQLRQLVMSDSQVDRCNGSSNNYGGGGGSSAGTAAAGANGSVLLQVEEMAETEEQGLTVTDYRDQYPEVVEAVLEPEHSDLKQEVREQMVESLSPGLVQHMV
jgi:hypothetical protein